MRNNDEKSFDERLHQAIAQNQGLKKAHTRWGLEEATDYAYQYWKLREKLQRTRARATILQNITNTNGSAKEASSIESINYDSSQHSLFKTILRSVRLSFHGVLSDYGENPFKVIKISIGIMISFAWLYLLVGDGFYMNSSVIGSETLLSQLVSTNTSWTQIKNPCFIEFSPLDGGCIGGIEGGMTHLLYAFYFSTITFTTLGYAGTAPAGLSRYIAMAQSFMGGLMIAYIIFVVGHRIGERATR